MHYDFEIKKILNCNILSISAKELLERMDSGVLITPNVDHLVKLQKDKELYDIYNKAEWVICDSQIVKIGLKFLGNPIKEVIPGSSFFPMYYTYHKDNENIKIFLLGAAEGIAKKAMETINKKVGRNIVIAAHSPSFGFEKNEDECQEIINIINNSGATVLVVGVGAPKQEKWIFKYKNQLSGIKLFMALGATIDFEAGNIKRAPIMWQKLKLEWSYRLIKDPKRLWKRYLIDDPLFFKYLFLDKSKMYKDPFNK